MSTPSPRRSSTRCSKSKAVDDPQRALTELQAALENMRSALTSGDLAHLLAAQATCASVGTSLPGAQPSAEFRQALRASLERARATLGQCDLTNTALLRIVAQARLDADGTLDYNRAGGVAGVCDASERESSVSCRA